MNNFWKTLPRPFLVQAPMEDVSDTVFRQMLMKCGRPDVFFTEFTNVDGVFSAGNAQTVHRLTHSGTEHPLVAQIWGSKPENYFEGAKYVKELGFDGVDINMGCPQKDVVKKGLCSGLIVNRTLATEVIQATIEGAGADFPVSVKTRIGMKDIITEDWIGFLLGFPLAALTIHGRTVKEMSKVPAHWDEIGKAVALRDSLGKETLIIGNGDVKDKFEALEKAEQTGVDGVMIARGMLEDIFAFAPQDVTIERRLELLADHMRLSQKTWGTETGFTKRFQNLKKYIKVYVRDFDGAAELRAKLMNCDSVDAALEVILSE